MFKRIGFIGCGNMGGALASCAAEGIKKQGFGELLLADADGAKAAALAGKLGGIAATNEQAAEADILFIAVKPQFVRDMLGSIAPVLKGKKPLTVSMVAGLSAESVREMAGCDLRVIRIMPNTASAVGEGMIQYCRLGASREEARGFCELMRSAGTIDELPEKLIDAASSVSGCGPAFLCLALEGMADGGVALGLPRDKALRYAAQTIAGLGRLALETGLHPGQLKDQVTSPGGTTIQGVRALEARGVRSAFMEAVIAAFEKTEELRKNT